MAVAMVGVGATASLAATETAGFVDVPGDAYFAAAVADFQAAGVFDGTLCAEGFCPLQSIDRKTMAVWIVRVIDGQDPPSITRSKFDDVDPTSFHARFIERLAALGVTRGCGDLSRFCPDRNVTRAQAAALLSRAYNLPAGPDHGFDDVPDNAWYADDVARLVASDITAGCNTTQFCPSSDMTRGQLVIFLWRAEPVVGHVVLDAEYHELSDIAADYRLGQPIEITVHYCSPSDRAGSTPNLPSLVDELNGMVKSFFESQSRATASSQVQQTINFTIGSIEHPVDLTSTEQSGERDFYSYFDICLSDNDRNNKRVLLLLDIRSGRWNGVARYGGPAISLTRNRLKDGYQGVVAHEVAHSFYYLRHPWVDYLQLCHVIKDIGMLNLLQKREQDKCTEHISNNSERLSEQQAREMLRSLVSYRFGHSIYSAIRDLKIAYLACYQREGLGWLTQGDCDDPPSAPSMPLPPRLEFVDEVLHVSWPSSTADDRAPVTDYNVQYRVAERDEQWIDVQHDGGDLFTRISGLMDGLLYEVRIQAANRVGTSPWSAPERLTKPDDGGSGPSQRVVLTVGPSARGEPTNAGRCGAPCRWLHVELQNFPPGPHTLVCAHNGVSQTGYGRGAWYDATVSVWPNDDTCFFGFPGNEVFVLVNPERRNGAWHNGIRSNTVVWPDCVAEPARCLDDDNGTDDLGVRISWGTDASGKNVCVSGQPCWNLSYQYIGDWPSPPYSVECWTNGKRDYGPFEWSGKPHKGCYYNYRTSTAQVVINGIRSNTITFPSAPPPALKPKAYDVGSAVGNRWNWDPAGSSTHAECARAAACRNIGVSNLADFGSGPYQLECWIEGTGSDWSGLWRGADNSGCYYWSTSSTITVYVKINGVESNRIVISS